LSAARLRVVLLVARSRADADADRAALEVGGLAQEVLDAALLREVERLRAVRDDRERGRRDAGLRDVEDLEACARRRARRRVAKSASEARG
jgi:hypothetical protein